MTHKHGGDVYTYTNIKDFSANINFRGMPAAVREAALQAVDLSVHYPDPECRTLRQALSERENRLAGRAGIRPGDIICGNGAAELMFALAGALRPTRVLLAAPSFFEYEQAFGAFGCRIERFLLCRDDGFAAGEEFLKAAELFAMEGPEEEETAIILGNPNNPTGRFLRTEILEGLIRLGRQYRLRLILDESFFDFLNEQDRNMTFSGVCRALDFPGLFVIRSFTKIYAMPGLRFGYGICTDRDLLARMHQLLQPWNVSVVAQCAAEAAASDQAFASSSAEEIASFREEMKAGLEAAGYRVYDSSANFLMLEGPSNLSDFCLLRGYLIRPCGNFPGLESAGDGRDYFRICVRSKEENRELLEVLRARMQEDPQARAQAKGE